jgi:hypothetical protein
MMYGGGKTATGLSSGLVVFLRPIAVLRSRRMVRVRSREISFRGSGRVVYKSEVARLSEGWGVVVYEAQQLPRAVPAGTASAWVHVA